MRLFQSDKDKMFKTAESSINVIVHTHVRIFANNTIKCIDYKILEKTIQQHFKTNMNIYLEHDIDKDDLIQKLFYATLFAINDLHFTSKLLAPNVHNGMMEGVKINTFAKSRIAPIQNFINELADGIVFYLAVQKSNSATQ